MASSGHQSRECKPAVDFPPTLIRVLGHVHSCVGSDGAMPGALPHYFHFTFRAHVDAPPLIPTTVHHHQFGGGAVKT